MSRLLTLLQPQVFHAISQPELLPLMFQVFLSCSLHLALLLVLGKADVLQPLVDVEAETSFLVEALRPSCDELFLCFLCICYDVY